jgi:hypothetical protein
MARHRAGKTKNGLPPLLVQLMKAAKRAGEDSEGADITMLSAALREFGEFAQWAVPTKGVFLANSDELSQAVERVAKEHFELDQAKTMLRELLDRTVPKYSDRDPIDNAIARLVDVYDSANFYAGLAAGIIGASR